MTYPAALSHFVIAMEVVFLLLVWVSLLANAPLEGLADPMHTPNPAKAPWYFLGLHELLHYFPPMVAGVLIPGLVVGALVIIPYSTSTLKVAASGRVRSSAARSSAQ